MTFDFIVIGAGIAGSSVAAALSAHSRVALIEAEAQPGYHATGRSAALFAPSYGNALFTALTRASGPFLSAPPPHFASRPVLTPRGALYLARPDQLALLRAEVDAMRGGGARIDWLSPDQARALVPALRPGYLAAAAHEPDVRDIDVEVLLRGYLRQALQNGTRLITAAPVAGGTLRAGRWQLALPEEQISGRIVINAAGAWADEMAARLGARPLGLRPLRRSAAIIDAPPGANVSGWPAVFAVDEAFYCKPDAGRLLISPADEEPATAGDAWAEDLAIAVAVERIESALTLEVGRVQRSWAGLRTFAPDRGPVIGFDAQVPGFFWYAGQGGYGIQSSPAGAALAAALACYEPVPGHIAAQGVTAEAVSPRRFA